MGELPTTQLLESTHEFPGTYMFKVIGRIEGEFALRVVTAVRDALARPDDPPHSVRVAAGGRHVAVTVEPRVDSAEEVIAIYQRLRTIAGLVMFL